MALLPGRQPGLLGPSQPSEATQLAGLSLETQLPLEVANVEEQGEVVAARAHRRTQLLQQLRQSGLPVELAQLLQLELLTPFRVGPCSLRFYPRLRRRGPRFLARGHGCLGSRILGARALLRAPQPSAGAAPPPARQLPVPRVQLCQRPPLSDARAGRLCMAASAPALHDHYPIRF